MKINNEVEVNVFQQAKNGQSDCGDSYFYIETENEFFCVLADGLGSGKYAKESSQAVINIIKNNFELNEEQLMKKCIKTLQGKRGVVLGILRLHFKTKTVTYSSIGNIGFLTKHDQEKKKVHIPQHGYLSNYERPLKKVVEQLKPGTIFLLYSDGVSQSDLFQTFIPFDNGDEWMASFPISHVRKNNDDTTVIAIYYDGRS